MKVRIGNREVDLQQVSHFVLDAKGDPDLGNRLADMLTQSTVAIIDQDRVIVTAYSDADRAKLQMVASDSITDQNHYLCEPMELYDRKFELVTFPHRADGPARVEHNVRGRLVTSHHYLWDRLLLPQDHADAVKLGLAEDQEAFKVWWAKRHRRNVRHGVFDGY